MPNNNVQTSVQNQLLQNNINNQLLSSTQNQVLPTSTNVNLPNNNIDSIQTNQALTFVGNDIGSNTNTNPFLENLLLQESRQRQQQQQQV